MNEILISSMPRACAVLRRVEVRKSLQDHCEEKGNRTLLDQWNWEQNGDLTPLSISSGSRQKVWWRCEHGHEWQARVSSRTGEGTGCPVCAGKQVIPGENDLAGSFPDIAAQWHPTKNGTLKPEGVTACSNRRIWWRCEKGHEWRTLVAHRTAIGTGCPYCAGFRVLTGFNDLATLEPDIAAQWHPELNGELTAQMVMPGSHKKVWWQCAEGHVWNAVVYSRTGPRKCGCPVCAGKVKEERQQRYVAVLAETVSKSGEIRI